MYTSETLIGETTPVYGTAAHLQRARIRKHRFSAGFAWFSMGPQRTRSAPATENIDFPEVFVGFPIGAQPTRRAAGRATRPQPITY